MEEQDLWPKGRKINTVLSLFDPAYCQNVVWVDELKPLLKSISYYFILPKDIDSFADITGFLQENHQLLHHFYLNMVLKLKPKTLPELSFDEFNDCYEIHYHNKMARLA